MNYWYINCVDKSPNNYTDWKNSGKIKAHTVWFHICEILESMNQNIYWLSADKCLPRVSGRVEREGRITKEHEKIFWVYGCVSYLG